MYPVFRAINQYPIAPLFALQEDARDYVQFFVFPGGFTVYSRNKTVNPKESIEETFGRFPARFFNIGKLIQFFLSIDN
ncbi:MAG: hypothetical protein ACK5PB_03755 [Pirellula sp.]|jgi:hypothetical protein